MEEISRLQAQLQEANDDLASKETILMDKETELSECKDRVTALEDQLVEYATTIEDQNKVVCGWASSSSCIDSRGTAPWVGKVVLLERQNAFNLVCCLGNFTSQSFQQI